MFCADPRRMAITDSGLDRISMVGGGSVYPAVQNLLLACRNEGLGCVLTTLLCMEEEKVKPPEQKSVLSLMADREVKVKQLKILLGGRR